MRIVSVIRLITISNRILLTNRLKSDGIWGNKKFATLVCYCSQFVVF